jgi:hypothetical protein
VDDLFIQRGLLEGRLESLERQHKLASRLQILEQEISEAKHDLVNLEARIKQDARRIRSHRMGLLGEQAVAEQLQRLLPLGYQIFHDVPGDGKWNIDHVVVGPAGVFVIETKYRTKRPGKAGERDHEAVFDGNKIQFPSGYDAEAPEQASRNARWLANMLTKATGERVMVQPVVALPGWWVTLKSDADVKVLSGKQVSGFIAKEPAQLSDKFIQQISYQLEQRCRDVEF